VTHSEIQELVAGYALDALDASEETIVADHLPICPTCAAEYHRLLEVVDRLGGAPAQDDAPASLRSRVLASADQFFADQAAPAAPLPVLPLPVGRRAARPPRRFDRPLQMRRFEWLAAAVLIVTLSVTTANMFGSNRQNQAELTRDNAALALLTSTETTNDQLARGTLANLPADTHGHWFHRAGVMTQVIVGEFLPPPPAGQHYEVWLLRASGSSSAGRMHIDATGYGRVIVMGSDGSDVRAVEITLEQGQPVQPGASIALRFPAP